MNNLSQNPRPYVCLVCGKMAYTHYSPANRPKTCLSPECGREYNLRHLAKVRKTVPAKISFCQVCGKEFIGKVPSKKYKFCSVPCRKEGRRQREREQKESIKTKSKINFIPCLRCGRLFLPTHKWNRICSQCTEINRSIFRLLDWCHVNYNP